jgi:hypothetical protein
MLPCAQCTWLGAAAGIGITLCVPANASPERKALLAAKRLALGRFTRALGRMAYRRWRIRHVG